MLSRRLLVLTLGLLPLMVTPGCKPKSLPDTVAARVDGEDIPRDDFDRQMKPVPSEMLADTARARELRTKLMDYLVMQRLLVQEAKRKGYKIDTAQVEQQLMMYKMQSGSDSAFAAQLKEANLTEAQLRAQIGEPILVQQLMREVVMPSVPEAPKAKLDSALNAPRIHARHILLTLAPDAPADTVARVTLQAEAIRAKAARPGADFASLAKSNSKDPGSAPNGGDLGFFGRGSMVAEFENAAFALKPGEVSPVVRSPFGLHIIKVDEMKTVRQVPADSARAVEDLRSSLAEKRFKAYTDSLKAVHKVELNPGFINGTILPADSLKK